jgi:importin-4
MKTDKWEDDTIRGLTPQLLPVFKNVLSDEEQLEGEVRDALIELVTWLNKIQPGSAPWISEIASS